MLSDHWRSGIEANNYGDAILAWKQISRKYEPTTGVSKTRLRKKFAKYKLDGVTINPKEWITELELFIGGLQKIDVHIDASEIMTNILSNFPKNTKQ